MSVVGQEPTFRPVRPQAALPSKADIGAADEQVRFGPNAEVVSLPLANT
jgi:hypothetical protein